MVRCQWCGSTATGTVTAKGLPNPIHHCDSDSCWDRSYNVVRGMVPRTWGPVKVGRGRSPRQAGPDLFDLLPEEGK